MQSVRTTRFLRKKFTPSRPPKNIVVKQSLLSQFLEIQDWRFCLVDAGAGYGKTSFLAKMFSSLQDDINYQPLWMTFDERDSDYANVIYAFVHLFASLNDCFKEFELSFNAEIDINYEDLLIELVNCADECLEEGKIYPIFLDAYDVAVSRDLDKVLIFLIENMNEAFRFIISGSYISPRIEDLRFKIPFIQYNSYDLMLDKDDFKKLAQENLPDMNQTDIDEICDIADSWPVSFAFANLATKDGTCSKMSVRQALEKYSKRFFEKEVLDRVSSEVYEFLVETAFLDFLTPALCDYVLETHNSKEILEYLESHNMYVFFNNKKNCYEHTKLFHGFLFDKFVALHPRVSNRLCTRATTWCDMHNLDLEKLKYLVLSSDVSFIEGSIAASIGLQRKNQDVSMMQYLLEQPSYKYNENPFLTWAGVWALVTAGFPQEGRIGLEFLKKSNLAQIDGLAYRYMLSICTALEGDSAASLAIIQDLLNNSDLKIPRLFQCLLIHMEGENQERLGHVKEAKDLYMKAMSLAERENSPFCILFDLYLLGQYFINMGDYEEASFYLKKGLVHCPKDSPMQGAFIASSAAIMLEHGNFAGAEEELRAAFERVTLNANIDMYADALITLSRWYSLQGNDIKALEVLNNLLEEVYGKTIPRNVAMRIHAVRICVAARLNENPTLRISEHAIDNFLDNTDLFRSIPCLLAKAHIEWHTGLIEECFKVLDLCEQQISYLGSSFFMTSFLVFRCYCYIELGNETKAMVDLNHAIELAMSNGYLSVFMEGGKPIHELIVKLVTSRKTAFTIKKYAQQILSVFEDNIDSTELNCSSPNEVSGYYALTVREREILTKLNSGMSRVEIAQSLNIAQNTVKSHLKKIYSKLGVHSRAEAYKVSQEGLQFERSNLQRFEGLDGNDNPKNNPE